MLRNIDQVRDISQADETRRDRPISVLLFTGPPILAAGFSSMLSDIAGFELSGTCPTLDTLRTKARCNPPDLLVIETSPVVSLDILVEIRALAPGAAIVLWVDAIAPEFASQAIGIGIKGVLRRNSSIELYERCLRSVAVGDLWLEQELSCALLSSRRVSIAPRQRVLMNFVAQGLRNKEIAWKMGITEGTVKVYLSHLFDRLGVGDRYELALLALKNLSADQSGAADWVASSHGEYPERMAIPATLISRAHAGGCNA